MNGCQVQKPVGTACGKPAIAMWDWGGPTLAMCWSHDEEMERHVSGCKACRERLVRTEGQA